MRAVVEKGMGSDVTIRRARSADLVVVAPLIAAFRDTLRRLAPDDRAIERGLARVLADRAVTVGLAMAGCQAVGYTLQRRHFSVWAQGEEALLEDLFVAEAARGRQVGRRLAEHAITEARVAGCRAMSLDTNERNEAANAIYRRLGFSCERRRWDGGRQIRHDLQLEPLVQAETGIHWGPWMVRW